MLRRAARLRCLGPMNDGSLPVRSPFLSRHRVGGRVLGPHDCRQRGPSPQTQISSWRQGTRLSKPSKVSATLSAQA
ncbi:hypothetical protein AAY473_013725 [Plecturocebus cupreus]